MPKEYLAQRLKDLRRRFSNSANVLQTGEGAERLPGKSLHAHWIVGRGLCIFRCETFENVARSRRRAALLLQVPVWSPFERTGHYAHWHGATAMVWLWDASKLDPSQSPAASALATGGTYRFRPEPMFLPRKADGVHLQNCAHGVDLQTWQDGVLTDSFWFSEPPGAAAIARVLGTEPTDIRAGPTTSPTTEPWPAPVAPVEWLQANERTLVASGLLALTVAAAGLETRVWTVYAGAAGAADRIAALEGDLGPMLTDRTAFLDMRRRNAGLAGLLAQPSQAVLIGLVDRAIPNETATFYRWTYQNGELAVVVEDAALSPLDYIERLEREPRFEQVRVQLVGNDRLEISLQVKAP